MFRHKDTKSFVVKEIYDSQSRFGFPQIIQLRLYKIMTIRTFLTLLFSLNLVQVFSQTPAGTPDLSLWLIADSGITVNSSDKVMQWNDYAQNGNLLTQSFQDKQGTYIPNVEILNNNGVISLDGLDDSYNFSFDESDIRTVFIIANHNTGNSSTPEPILGHSSFFDFHGVAGQSLFSSAFANPLVLNGNARVNGVPQTPTLLQKNEEYTVLVLSANGNLRINQLGQDRSINNRFWDGSFAELILFSRQLEENEILLIEEYLFNKYAPPVDLGPDINRGDFCPFTLSIPNRYSDVEWSTGSEELSIEVSTPGKYWVEATSIFGLTSTDTIEITFPGNYLNDFSLCSNKDSLWNPDLAGFEFQWQDGSNQPSFLIGQAGDYFFTATDLEGCSYTSPIVEVSIDNFPEMVEISAPNTFCEGNMLSLSGIETYETIEWSNSSDSESITPLAEGQYWVEVANENGCIAQDTIDIEFSGTAPETSFSSSLTCLEFGVELNDESTTSDGSIITNYSWLYQGDEFATESSAQITFNSGGTYQIDLLIETSAGCLGTTGSQVVIPGELEFEIGSPTLCANQENELLINATIPFDEIESLSIEVFDEVGTSIITSSSSTFTLPSLSEGFYEVEINTTSNSGCNQNKTEFIEVISEFYCTNPSNYGEMILWLDGTENVLAEGNTVVSWGDKSSASNDAVSPAIINRPLYIESFDSLNSHGVLRFDGENDFMDFSELTNIRTIFLVYKHSPELVNQRVVIFGHPNLFQFHGSTDPALMFSSTSTSEFIRNGTTRTNGIEQDPLALEKPIDYEILTINPTDNLTAQYITNDRGFNARYWDGDYAEILFFSDSLGEESVLEIEQYLRYKYAPPIDLPRQIVVEYGFCDTTLIGYKPWYRTYDWSTGSQDSSIVVNESGWYELTVTDLFGYTSTDSVEVIFDGSFKLEDEVLCALDVLSYDTDLNTDDYSIEWSTSETTSSITITEEGLYSVTVSDTLGCSYTSPEIFVDVDSFPVTADLIDIPTFCLGNDLFLASGFAEAEEYLWSTDETTPFIQPQESGEYWVEAINANGCVGRDTVEVDIVGVAPSVDFGFSPPCENAEVEFEDLTVPEGGVVTEWEWVFGSRVFDSAQTPEFDSAETPSFENVYPATGQYPVELTVTLDNGCTGTTRDTIMVNPLPLVNFSAPIVCAGNEVFFESQSGVPGNGDIAQWDWSFGNGSSDAGLIGSTTFEETGFNTVTHIVTTTNACTDSLVRNVEVLGSPIADFAAEDVCLGSTVVFNEDVDISESGPVFYNWQFGDGFFSNFPNTSHEYAQPGIYEVTLTATGNNVGLMGCVDAVTKEIRVYEPSSVEIATADACVGGTAILTDVSEWSVIGVVEDPVTAREWTITDGPTGTQEGVIGGDSAQVFVPAAAGTFDVSLEVMTEAGCASTATGSFLVQAIPMAEFELELPETNPPFAATPLNLSEDGINFEWLVNGEVVSTEFEPELNFNEAGSYEVALVATNDLDCNDTAKAAYSVIVPEYDLALIGLEYEIIGSDLRLRAIVNNRSNVRVERFDAEVSVGRDIRFDLEVEESLPAGQVVEVPIGTTITYLPGRDLPFACLRIDNPNGIADSDSTNNYLCTGLDNRKATFASPYPNPAQEEVKLTFVVPEAGVLRVEITAADGRLMEDFELNLEEGLNTVDYPLTGWSEGMYFLKFSFGNQEEVHRLVVAR